MEGKGLYPLISATLGPDGGCSLAFGGAIVGM